MSHKSAIMYLTITLANRSHCYFSRPGRKFSIPMQDYKFVRVAVMIVPPWLHSLQTDSQTDSQTDRQLLTGYTISSASGTNKNSEHVMLMTSFVIYMTLMLYKCF